ncbi:hypothetical protein BKA57DRAFT_223583 [Linnemannia elongata]|nr:hypothetical protein BKA57DRAFT_223583 [Linnemannia elongata]
MQKNMLVPIQQDLSASHFHSLSRPPLLTFCTSCHKSSNESSNNKSKMTFIWQTHRHQSTKNATKEVFEGQSGVKRDFCRITWYFSFSTPQRGGDDLERTPPPLLSTRAISRCSRKWRRGSKGCKSKPRLPNEKKISLSLDLPLGDPPFPSRCHCSVDGASPKRREIDLSSTSFLFLTLFSGRGEACKEQYLQLPALFHSVTVPPCHQSHV